MSAHRSSTTAPRAVSVLLVEDDDVIGGALSEGLTSAGLAVQWARTGAEVATGPVGDDVDVVVLDLGLPDVDGIDVARALRLRRPDVLLVLLTARGRDIDVVVGLDAGADDYLVKPVSVTVLLARMRAHLRRGPAPTAGQPSTMAAQDLAVDLRARRCTLDGVEIPLRSKEFDLLVALLADTGSAVSREDLMARVWDENWFGSTKTLDVTMASLRARLEAARAAAGGLPRLPRITTLRGFGYRLEIPQD